MSSENLYQLGTVCLARNMTIIANLVSNIFSLIFSVKQPKRKP